MELTQNYFTSPIETKRLDDLLRLKTQQPLSDRNNSQIEKSVETVPGNQNRSQEEFLKLLNALTSDKKLDKQEQKKLFHSRTDEAHIKKSEPISQTNRKSHKNKEEQKLRDVSEQMEAFFVNMMFKEMRKSLGKHQLIDGGMAEDIFKDMLYHEYSGIVAKNTKLGLAEMIYQQLSPHLNQTNKSNGFDSKA